MAKPNEKRRDRIQNALILLLSLSALFLFYITQFGSLPQSLSLPTLLKSHTDSVTVSGESTFLQEMDWPVTVLTASGGARACVRLSTDDSRFTAAESFLEDTLRDAGEWVGQTSSAFREAMDRDSVCIFLPCSVPFGILAARLGLDEEEEMNVSRLLFAEEGGVVSLYISDGTDCVRIASSVRPASLSDWRETLGGEPCTLADEGGEATDGLDPLTLCPERNFSYPPLTAETAETVGDYDLLLPLFGFNARGGKRYTEAGGAEVIVEAPRRLRITPEGTVEYRGNREDAPDLFTFSENAELPELAGGIFRLLQHLLGDARNGTSLYLSEVEQQEEDVCVFRFEAMAGGLPIAVNRAEDAATVTVEKGTVTALFLRYRTYAVSDGESLLLPFRQALAAAGGGDGRRMDLTYIDSGGETASLYWFMR